MKVWCKKISKINKGLDVEKVVIGLLVLTTLVSGGILASTRVKADDSATTVVDEINVVIPVACSMSSTSSSNNVYTETVTADSYTPNIGDTRIKVFCNDFAGFSVYAVGFTNDTIGNNTMATSTTPAQTISTGTATSGNTSAWAMKLTKVTNTSGQQDITYGEDNLAITDGTTNYNGVYRTVPATYTKVATYTNNNGPATTDTALGSNIDARYAVFVSATQPAGTYEGKVKYMLVHPATMEAGTYTLAYNANGGTGTMTSETGLPNYQDHTIKANTFTAPTGYMFAGWCTVQDSNATAQNPQTTCAGDSYADGATLPASPSTAATAGGTLTLYAYWKVPTINDLSYMQDFATLSSAEKTAVFGSMTTGIQYQLKDSRDQKDYYISKLADGNVWMTQNLDFDIVDGGANLNSTNTDVPANWEDGGNLTNTYTNATWNGSTTRPESYNPGDVCWLGEGKYDYDDTCADRHYHLGNYYNWTAAVAMSDSGDYTGEEDVNQSICPAGWTLPKDDGGNNTNSGTYYNLVSQYGWSDSTYTLDGYTMWGSPLYFPLSGDYWDGNVEYVGSDGLYWSSVVSDSDGAYGLCFHDDGLVGPDDYDDRDNGYSVRCVAR